MIGNVYSDPNYVFKDGQIGHKLFIVIAQSPCKKFFLTVKTTSQFPTKIPKNSTECLKGSSLFYIREYIDVFRSDTWVQFTADSFREIASLEINAQINTQKIIRIGSLKNNTINAIKNCLKNSQDISDKHLYWVFPKT